MKRKKFGNVLLSVVLTAVLVVTSAAPVTAEGAAADYGAPEAAIAEMLSAGEYIEGEAIVLMREGASLPESGISEELAVVEPEAVEQTVADNETLVQEALPAAEEAGFRLLSSEPEPFSIRHISDPSRTTEEILRDLYSDPDVIAAEPNYIIEDPASAEGNIMLPEDENIILPEDDTVYEEQGSDQDPILLSPPVGTAQGDLTPLQWYIDDTGLRALMPYSPTDGYSLNVPGWAEGRTQEDAPANSSGTVCIMDYGIDVTHPDLKNVLFTFSDEQQERFGCGPYGMNASGDGFPKDDVMDRDSHGTHCAGIVASQWNGYGTSGIANGTKIFAVRIFGSHGMSQESSVIEGFEFLVKSAKEINLKAVNCSWGTIIPQFIYMVMVNALGRQGVNTMFASGNRDADLDEYLDSGGTIRSIYAATIDAAMPNGKRSDFTCYGQASTDVFVTGVSMLSTMPSNMAEGITSYDYARFFPDATDPENLVFGTERFDSNDRTVRFFASNPALDENAEELGRTYGNVGLDDERSAAVNVQKLQSGSSSGGMNTKNGSVYLAIPVTSAAEARWISAAVAMSDPFKPSAAITSVTAAGPDGNPVEVTGICVKALGRGYDAAASYSIYMSQWSTLSLNVKGYLDCSNEVHQMIADGKTIEELIEEGYYQLEGYSDVGEVSGLYEWTDDGNRYIIAEIGMGPNQSGSLQNSTTLYIDNVGVGAENAYTGCYLIQSGTSMATPAACGSLAVIAKDETPSWELSDEELEVQARERIAKLLASVDYDQSLEKLCTTGGRINLHGQTEFTKKAPLIKQAIVENKILTVDGYYLGESGNVYVDGAEVPVLTRTDECITADVSMLDNGSHVVKIVNDDGVVRQDLFSYSEENTAGKKLYERTHTAVFADSAFAEEESDRLFGSIAECRGSIYAICARGSFEEYDSMWKYDIENDRWSKCALPEGIRGMTAEPGSLISLNGVLYFYGAPYSEDGSTTYRFWKYDPSGDTWTMIDMELPGGSSICVFQNQILIADGSYSEFENYEDYENVEFSLADPVKRTLTTLSGTSGASVDVNRMIAASNEKIYYAYTGFGEEFGEEVYGMARLFIDIEKKEVTSEDLTDAFNKACGGNAGWWKAKDTRGLNRHLALVGIPNGAALIGSSEAGADTHIIYDDAAEFTEYDRTSCYHTAQEPLAVYADEWIYALGYNATEQDSMYFRSTHAADEVREITEAQLKYGSLVYKGEPRTQSGTTVVKAGTKVLAKGTDYSITYSDNTEVGTATVTVTGKGKYSGTKTLTFKITPKPTTISSVKSQKKGELTVAWNKQAEQTTGYQVQYAENSGFTDGKVTKTIANNGTVTNTYSGLTPGKKYWVRIRAYKTADGKNYYSSWSAAKTVIIKTEITEVQLKYDSLVYKGEPRTQSGTTVVKAGTKVLTKGTDYSITYSNNTNVGTVTVTVTGKGNYCGTKKVYFKITPKPAAMSSVESQKAGEMTVTWNKQAEQTTGYQVQYAANSGFTEAKVTKTVAGSSTLSNTYSGLTSGKKYWVRIRTYKTAGGKNYYSKWSAAKTVMIK